MSVRRIKAGTTDVSVVIRIIDSGDGTPETGVVFNTSGIDLWYRRDLEASTDITEATLAALTTAHTDGGFLHINDGWYRLDLPDAACATGAAGVQIGGTVTGMVVLAPYIELPANVDTDVYSDTTIIASQLLIVKSDASDIKSALVKVYSDTTAVETGVSDTESALVKVYSDTTKVESDTAAIETGVSDTESALVKVYSDTTKVESDTAAIEVGVSDTESALVKVYSDTTKIESDAAAVEVGVSDTESALVKVYSDTTIVASQLLIVKSDTSDIKSAQVKIYSDTTKTESDAAAIEVGVSDTESALVKVYSDTTIIASDTLAIEDQLSDPLVTATCDAGSTTTSIVAASTSPASGVNDQFNGRVMIFDKDTDTVALRGQATDITDYVHATKTFTVTALTTGPAAGDTFKIY